MPNLLQVSLDGGGSILVRTGPGEPADLEGGRPVVRSGPVPAGRVGDLVDGVVDDVVAVASCSLREAMEPVTRMSQQLLEQLGKAGPRQVQVEFGVELTAQAGAVLAKAGTGCHLTVTLIWGAGDGPAPADG